MAARIKRQRPHEGTMLHQKNDEPYIMSVNWIVADREHRTVVTFLVSPPLRT